MSQITTALLLSLIAVACSLSGCGDKNSKVIFNTESGEHSGKWTTEHKNSARANMVSCVECHGETLAGGISQVSCTSPTAVSGFRCHATSPAYNPTGCVSCHGGLPSGPFGNSSPNRKFAHGKHTLLTGCNACHLNAGYGTANHALATADGGFSHALVNFSSSTYKAKTVTTSFSFDAGSGKCFGISCHGGKDTPAWNTTGSLSIANCESCHQQLNAAIPESNQYNSFYSGSFSGTVPATNLHSSHLGRGLLCTDCHNIGILNDYKKHFAGLTTKTFTAPGMTIGGTPTAIDNYDIGTRKCSTDCHSFNAVWIQ